MRFFKDASIRKRLTAIIMLSSTAAVVITTIAISAIGMYNLRASLIDELSVSASIVGDRNTAALLFADDKLATENMKVFSVKRSILRACLYDKQNHLFASYAHENLKEPYACPDDVTERVITQSETVELMQAIIKMDDRIGSMYLLSDLKEIDAYIRKQTIIALSVMFAALIVSYFLAVGLQRAISVPILSLAATAREISLNKDYTIRAHPFGEGRHGGDNEISQLTESFNSMLSEIGERNRQLKQQNVALSKARDEAEAANRAKSQFLANIGHELRTPLNAIIGFSSILMNQLFGALGDAKYLEYARDINHSGTHLLDIINDILDLARAESGRLELTFEEIHVSKAIAKCISILSEKAARNQITLSSDVPKQMPPLIADRLRFIQIVLNVLSNAIKFTAEGGKVHLSVSTRKQGGEPSHFIIAVTDTGIGMQPEDITKAFQSFGQIDSGLNRKYEGAGLGLPLTKKLLELHHGTIDLESKVGVGTTVMITIPAVPPGGIEGLENNAVA